jgi:hypothetical protein
MLFLLLCEIDMPKTIPSLALVQEQGTVLTRSRVSKVPFVCHAIVMNSHDIQITASELTNITHLLDNIPLCMNCVIGEATSLGARPDAIGGDRKNLSSPDHHGDVETCHVCLPHSHRIGVHEELGNQRVVTGANRSGHV